MFLSSNSLSTPEKNFVQMSIKNTPYFLKHSIKANENASHAVIRKCTS